MPYTAKECHQHQLVDARLFSEQERNRATVRRTRLFGKTGFLPHQDGFLSATVRMWRGSNAMLLLDDLSNVFSFSLDFFGRSRQSFIFFSLI